ncbi:MAG TPA: heavy metal-responsive transcriptional regulator [Candidatus Marinimicrobia bacterium]|nr:heavy metal-responsive transcriptional regulator [Candidatus Neomarinimicrobiota bacterium]
MDGFTVGILAKETKLNIETIRYYERNKLLPEPKRTQAGYRLYTNEDINRLHFIMTAKRHGFSLKEIKELLALRVDPLTTCEDVRQKATEKIQVVEEKIRELNQIRKALSILVAHCQGVGPKSDCPILDAFEKNR